MKQHIILLFTLSLLMISCGDDEPLSEAILGTWDFHSIEISNCDNSMYNLSETQVDGNGCITIHGETSCNVFIVFNANGSAEENYTTEYGTNAVDLYEYTVNDENNSLVICEGANDCSTFTIEGDTMTRTLVDDSCTIVVTYKKS